ncbi:hypothetical protein NGM37_46630 [Streptomyces sp. TRM76130]|nr:hypothetical protein [Streptomyces sp. TRM76130]
MNYRDSDAVRRILDGAGPVDRIIMVALTDNPQRDLAVAAERATTVTYAAQPVDPALPVFRLM